MNRDLPKSILTCYRTGGRGGLSRRLDRMLLSLARTGTDVHYAAAASPPLAHEHIRFHELDIPFSGRNNVAAWTAFFLLAPLRLARLAERLRPEAIVVFGGIYGWLASRAARRHRIPLIVFSRTRPASNPNPIERRLARRGYLAADGIVVQSQCARQMMADWIGTYPDAMQVLPNDAVLRDWSAAERATARRDLGLVGDFPDGCFLIAATAGLHRLKGTEAILQAMAMLADHRVRLVIFGDGPTRSYYESLAVNLRVADRVVFAGWRDDVQCLIGGCDLAVIASRREGCSNSVLEAIGAGVPCLAARIPETEEILVHDELLFPVGDAAALARLMEAAVSNPDRLRRLAELSRQRANAMAFDWDVLALDVIAQAFRRANPEMLRRTEPG